MKENKTVIVTKQQLLSTLLMAAVKTYSTTNQTKYLKEVSKEMEDRINNIPYDKYISLTPDVKVQTYAQRIGNYTYKIIIK